MSKLKYNIGDEIGPSKLILLNRYKKKNKWYGTFKCPVCNQNFDTRLDRAVSQVIPDCGCRFIERCTQNGMKYYDDLSNQRFGKLIAMYPVRTSHHKWLLWHCKCDCGNECEVASAKLKDAHTTSCGKCHVSRGESAVKNCLDDLNIKYEQQYRFQDCKNPKTNYPLRFDFYLPDYNCCIEYDGAQHFVGWYNSDNIYNSLKENQYRDNIKNKYCQENNIKLIRIPYWDRLKITNQYLLSLLENK